MSETKDNLKDKKIDNFKNIKKSEIEKKSIFRFFSNYFWIAIVVLLLTLLVQSYFQSTNFIFIAVLLFFSTFAISIIVATVFSYTLGTKEFIDFIEKKLEDIVISRKFLSNIDIARKEEALYSILQPSVIKEKGLYSNLNKYYEHFIADVINVSKKNIRTMYRLDVTISYDENNILYSLGNVCYRLYPSEKGYLSIPIGINDSQNSGCKKIVVNPPNEKAKEIDIDKLEFKNHLDGAKIAAVDLKEYNNKYAYLDIEIDFIEYGHDHWIAFQFVVLQPTDGFNFKLRCEKDITIKEKMYFDMNNDYNTSEETNSFISLSNYKWMQERSGLVVVASRPEIQKN